MQVQLSQHEEKELQDIGMRDEDIRLFRRVTGRRAQPIGVHRVIYSVSQDRMRGVMFLISERNPKFAETCGFAYDRFIESIYNPMAAAAKEKQEARAKGWKRRCQLPFIARVFRMLMYLRGESEQSLARTFDQHSSTVARDCDKLVKLAKEALVPQHIHMPHSADAEYEALVGTGAFAADFPRAIYAGDMTSVRIRRPSIAQKVYYDGHHNHHALNILTLVDGTGKTRYIAGPTPGSLRDTIVFTRLNLPRRLKENFVLTDDVILYDCGAGRGLTDNLWLCPKGGYTAPARDLTDRVMDLKIRRARAIVEQSYSRIKLKWKILGFWKRSSAKMYDTYCVCAALVNIDLEDHPFSRSF